MVNKYGGIAPNDVFNTTGGLKFGGMVQYHHTNIACGKKLADFNLVVERHIAKPSNLIPRQILQLYGMLSTQLNKAH